jgi:hypothetical protein
MELLLTPDGPTDAEAAGRWRAARDRVGQGAVEADLGTLAAAGLWWHARVGEAAATLAALPGDEWPLEPLIVATSLGPLWIGSPDTNAGSGSPWLLVDPGGDDAWSFAEVDGVPGSPVRAFIDLGGDDTWRSADLGPGGAAFGLTTGWEQEGNDLYDGGALSWGAAFFGVAGWIDRAGDDVWNGGVGNFGWAAHGLALLRDDAGADRYTLDTLGLGVAGAGGHAVAVDADGRATSRFVGPRRPLGQGAVDPDERARTGRAGLWVNGGTARWSGRGAGDQERGILLGPPNGLTPEAEVPELVRVLWELATGQGDAERLRRAALGSAEAPSALAQHASDPALGPDERRVALTVLAELPARIGDGEAVLAALRLWEGFHDDPDLGTRRAAWRLLQAWCEAGAGFDSVGRVHVEQAGLTALQGERDAATWDAVAATLGRVGSGAVAPALAEALPPGRSERVHRALDALTRLLDRGETAAVVRVLFPLVTEPGRLDPGTLRPVLAVLGRTGHRDLVGLISERREDADPRVRLAVADLAGQVKDREVVGILRKWERAETEESVRVAIAAALAVKR